MVKTIKLCKINFTFFMKSLESKKKKLTITSFYYLRRENVIERFTETYLHRPIKTLQFLVPEKIQICLTYLQNI